MVSTELKAAVIKDDAELADGEHYLTCATHYLTTSDTVGFKKEVKRLKKVHKRNLAKQQITPAPAPAPTKRPSPLPEQNPSRKVSCGLHFVMCK